MTSIALDKAYDVPSWKDTDGSIWRKHLDCLHFAGKTGWAVGSGQILRTQDGGRNWSNQIKELNEGIVMPARVFAIDELTAWVIMVSHRAVNNCYYTRDGGKQWQEKRSPRMVHPDDVFFFDQSLGWIISDDGDVPAGEAIIHITCDGGCNWKQQELEIKGVAKRLRFYTPNEGLLIQHTTNEDQTVTVCNLLRSCDGGHNWRVLKGFNRLITDVCATDRNNIFVVGEGGFISGTTDGGQTWKRCYTRTRKCLNAIELNEHGKGVAAGDFGLIMTTDDAGKHWTNFENHCELNNIVDLSFVEPDRAIVATSTAILSMRFN
jgi:photosystem II stability/assembly factor-like uncharacterized protein